MWFVCENQRYLLENKSALGDSAELHRENTSAEK